MSSDETLTTQTPSDQPVADPAGTDTAAPVEAVPVEAVPAETAAVESEVPEPVADQPATTIADSTVVAADAPVQCEPQAETASCAGETPSCEGETASGDAAAPEEPATRRPLQLNPVVEELKAIPTQMAPRAGDGLLDSDVQAAANQIASALGGNAIPIEIPPDTEVDLGDLEAEIEAAMVTEQSSPAAVDPAGQEMPAEGKRVTGTIQSIHGDDVFVDLGARIPGVLQMRQFEGGDPPEVGKQIQVVVRKVDENLGLITVNIPGGKQRLSGNWDAVEKGQIVDCVVSKTNKGGLEVTIGSLRAFLPASQVDFGFIENLDSYVGQKLQVKITEVNPQKRNLVVSRRQLMIDERKFAEQGFWESIQDGAEFQGRVKTIKDYGAFIDLGAVDGFLHIGQISWTHIKHPNEVLVEGQEVTVKVTRIERDKKKISLTMKHLTQNPWNTAGERYPEGSTVSGRVTRTTEFGAFVELEPGIEGMIHISELDWKRIRRTTDVVTEGQAVQTKVLGCDTGKRRISLSIKQLTSDPQQAEREAREKAEEEAEAARPAVQRKAREDLKGGISAPGAGGLFGNPNDFH